MLKFIGLLILIVTVTAVIFVSRHGLQAIKIESPAQWIKNNLFNAHSSSVSSGGLARSTVSSAKSGAPVFQKREFVRIGYVRPKTNFQLYAEIGLDAQLNKNEFINLTGWTVKTNNGGEFRIPKAQDLYATGGPESDIFLKTGERVKLYSLPAVKGNFRLNKCIGYLDDAFPLTPRLPRSCPNISRSEISRFTGQCQSYLLSLGSCKNPALNPPIPTSDTACQDFIQQLNYTGCVAKHKFDSDFRSNEWRVWIGSQMDIFDALHDHVRLYDQNGTLINEYSY